MAEKLSVEDRIKHFLRLAEDGGATQHERDLASQQAERLMAKHLVDRLALDLDSDRVKKAEPIVTQTVWIAGGSGTFSYDLMIGLCDVARAMQCYPHYVDCRKYKTYDRATGKAKAGLQLNLTGFESDVAEAKQMIESFLLQATLALRAWNKTGEAQNMLVWADRQEAYRIRCGFMRNFGIGAGSRIRETRKSVFNEYEGAAVAIIDRTKQVNDWVGDNMKLRTKQDRRMVSNRAASAGYAAGREASGSNRQGGLGQNSRAIGR